MLSAVGVEIAVDEPVFLPSRMCSPLDEKTRLKSVGYRILSDHNQDLLSVN
jgi:hypothetical protein